MIEFIQRGGSLAGLYLVTRPRAWYYWKFTRTNEKKYLQGELKPTHSAPSVIFYTLNKAGSNAAHSLIEPVLKTKAFPNLDWEGYWAVNAQIRKQRLFSSNPDASLFSSQGFYYGPLRHYVHLKNQTDYKIIVLLRDPRDILTSHYFSMTESHPVLTTEYLDKRMKAQHTSIDKHVLEYARLFKDVFNDYYTYLKGQANVLWLSYEEMVTDTENWLKKLDSFFEYKGDFAQQITNIRESKMFAPRKESKQHHIRKITPGDFREKLKRETIAELNTIFAEVLQKEGYAL